jgi:hypothetical protein
MKEKFLLFGSLAVVIVPLILFGGYFLIKENSKEIIDSKIIEKQFADEMNEVIDLSGESNGNELNPVMGALIEKYSSSEEALKYYFAAAGSNDINLFLDGMTTEAVIKDIATFEETADRNIEIQNLMNRITRKNSLEQIVINDVQSNDVRDKFFITLIYKQGEVNTSLDLSLSNLDAHSKEKIYLVNSSSLKLINDIEKKLGVLED